MAKVFFCSFVGLLLTVHLATASNFGQVNRRRTQMKAPDGRTQNHLQNPRLGAIEPELSRSRRAATSEPEISPECKKLGYCIEIPDYPKEQVKQVIATLGDDVREKFQRDELDTDDVQIAQRFGSDAFQNSLCGSSAAIIEPDALPDKNDVWWTVLQDKANNLTQRFRTEICDYRGFSCASTLVSYPPGYSTECDQVFSLRSVLVLDKQNKVVAQKTLRLPSCCTCLISTD